MRLTFFFILLFSNILLAQVDEQAYALRGIKEIVLNISIQYDGIEENSLSVSEEYIRGEIKYRLNMIGIKCRENGKQKIDIPVLNLWITFSDLEQFNYKNIFEFTSEMSVDEKLYVPNAKRKMYCTVWKGYRTEGKRKYSLWKDEANSTIAYIINSIKGFINDYNDVN